MNSDLDSQIISQQKSEITEHTVYKHLAKKSKNLHNKNILNKIASDELRHYNFWKNITKKNISPNWFSVYFYYFVVAIFGVTFALKQMEMGENEAVDFYKKISKKFPSAKAIIKDEISHEQKLINMLHDQKLQYAGAIVLGLNDALVEISGTLAGLTFAFKNSQIVGITGIIMGVAAALSMTVSEFLSASEEVDDRKKAMTSAFYTGIAYIFTVVLLVTPYFLFTNIYNSLIAMLLVVITIIFFYTYFISIPK
jgi:VIT1/CCC1 family predicted Fe2+/Mn2+ transporter